MLFSGVACMAAGAAADWAAYLGGPERNHYSTLSQINTSNVTRLRVAWEYCTGDHGEMQCNPIVVKGVLYGLTASNSVFALDAATGRELWRHSPPHGTSQRNHVLRGVVFWSDGKDQRILFTSESWLHAIDARTGDPIATFGEGGKTSLKASLGDRAHNKWVVSTTPGAVFEDIIIMPTRVSEGADSAPGFVQAFNVRTGKLAWTFRTIPGPGEFGHETWPKDAHRNINVGGANSWAGMAIDLERATVFAPTGSAAPDFWGGDRKGENLFANCLIALDAHTGRRKWHYQFVRHDLWDRDLPAPPNLVTIQRDGRKIDVVAQVTKSGHVFVFDRDTGKPLFPIEEVAAPPTTMPGDAAHPTQPLPLKPAPFARQTLTGDDISPFAANREALLETFRRARTGAFQPFSLHQDTVLFPGFDGGAEWGGVAVDPDGTLYINANEMACLARMKATPSNEELAHLSPGNRIYDAYCIPCHGADRTGNPAAGIESIVDLGARRSRDEVTGIITSGKGMMPGFPMLSTVDKQLVVDFLLGAEKVEDSGGSSTESGAGPETRATANAPSGRIPEAHVPYRLNGYVRFVDSQGYPAISPPWGSLTAIDLNTGEHRWQIALGEFKELTARGIPPTGAENYGGPVVTAGGLLFIAATKDGMFRAFDKKSGNLLWEHQLPAAGFATPSTYEIGGKQYVVIAAGGAKLGTMSGDSYVAFALP